MRRQRSTRIAKIREKELLDRTKLEEMRLQELAEEKRLREMFKKEREERRVSVLTDKLGPLFMLYSLLVIAFDEIQLTSSSAVEQTSRNWCVIY